MRIFKGIFIKDWQYKVLAVLMGIALWFVLNMGDRVSVTIERPVEIMNQEVGYEYRLDRKKVRIRLKVMERFVSEEVLEWATAGISVKGLKEGEYSLKVEVKNLPRFLVSIEKVEPEHLRVKVLKTPGGGQ
ncbi:MAG: hypothetical protein NZ851_04025 [Aquificaceae bacterium]|nr:hypothetical protein [Aquificaceae bacterium]